MTTFHKIPLEIKDQILARVKEGVPATQLATEHGISSKTIYGWISGKVRASEGGLMEINQLQRKVSDLTELVGVLSLELHSIKKKRPNGK